MIDRGVLVADGADGVVGRLIGVDVFSERSLRSFTQMQSSLDEDTFRPFLTEPGQVVLVDALASAAEAKAGDDAPPDRRRQPQWTPTWPASSAPPASPARSSPT